MATKKYCPGCDCMKAVTDFGRDVTTRDGLHSNCKTCRRASDIRRNQTTRRRASRINHRARDMGLSGRITGRDIERKLSEQNNCCRWCARELDDGYEVDHIRPLGHGYRDGDNIPENIAISCSSCNRDKADKPLMQWLGILASRGIRHELYTGKHYQQPLFEKET